MAKLRGIPKKVKQFFGSDLKADDSVSTPPSQNSQRSALRVAKSPEASDRELKILSSPALNPADSSASLKSTPNTATCCEPTDLWERAEQILSNDQGKREILQAYFEILESELGSGLKARGTADRQEQLCELLDAKTKELEKKKWMLQFGEYNVDFRIPLTRAFKSVLLVKDIVNSAAIASPPAAIACAGVTIILTVS
jgi:N-terminal domain of NWD NACHT-NTPase